MPNLTLDFSRKNNDFSISDFVFYFLIAFSFCVTPLFAQIQQHDVSNSESNLHKSIAILVDQRLFDEHKFIQALKHDSIALRMAALKGLGRIGGEEISPLIEPFFNHNNSQLRRAAVFAAGLSGNKQLKVALWKRLDIEKDETVKQEIYLSIGSLGGEKIVARLLAQTKLENHLQTKSAIFQALVFTLTYSENANAQLESAISALDIEYLLNLFQQNNEVSYSVFYFLARIKNVEQLIQPSQLQKFTSVDLNLANQRMLARLIGKSSKLKHPENRALLSWLIEKSESNNVALASESIIAMGSLVDIPQTRIQLGKLHASPNPLIAQMALQVLANSSLEGMQIVNLLKNALKNERPSMIIAAISGLVKRQSKDEMTWAVKILAHENAFVRVNFAKIIAQKNKEKFRGLLTFQTKDPNEEVSNYARKILKGDNDNLTKLAITNIDYIDAIGAPGTVVKLTTTAGEFKIKMKAEALFSAANFIRLVNTGYYNGTYFSRMIGNFVAQGGDNIGNLEGGNNATFREEISYATHSSGTIGMATSGKDTANGQFFINIGDNIHLDRHYTVFAYVIDGMDTVLRLSNGDQIINANIVK